MLPLEQSAEPTLITVDHSEVGTLLIRRAANTIFVANTRASKDPSQQSIAAKLDEPVVLVPIRILENLSGKQKL